MNNQHKVIAVTILSFFLSNAVSAQCDVQSIDIKTNKSVADKLQPFLTEESSFFVNSVDVDGDNKRDYLLVTKNQSQCNDHGCSFLAVKEFGNKVGVIRTGYVPFKDGLAQCDATGKIVFYSNPHVADVVINK